MSAINATIGIRIVHWWGPEIADPKHVLAWLVADDSPLEGKRAGFTFGVCAEHPDPEECDHKSLSTEYEAQILSAAVA